MDEKNVLADRFECNRAHLRAVAYRMLGSASDAEDAVQEAWLRLARSDTGEIGNLAGWLTTVVARVCLDMLRSRKSRREDPLGQHVPEPTVSGESTEQEAEMAELVGLALLVVLQTLAPAERIAFVLHDMFDLPFDEIAPIVGRTPAAARQLASRARRRVQGAERPDEAELSDQQKVVDAFLTAARGGDLQGLLAALDPDVAFRADDAAVRMGGVRELRGADAAARFFLGRAQAARAALIDGAVGVVVAPNGRLMLVLSLTITNGKITAINVVADPERLGRIELSTLGG